MTSRSGGSPSSLNAIRSTWRMRRIFRSLPGHEHQLPERREGSLSRGLRVRILIFDEGIAAQLAHITLLIDIEFLVAEHHFDLFARRLVGSDVLLAAEGDHLDAV